MEEAKQNDTRLPAEMRLYFGDSPGLIIVDEIMQCEFCNQRLIPQALSGHIEQCMVKQVNKESEFRYKYKSPATEIDLADFENNLENSLLCNYRGLEVKPSCLNTRIEQSHVLTTTSNNPGTSVSVVNTFTQSEVDTSSCKDTSSSNSSPIWESDKNNIYDSCFSSSSSNSVNIVRLKQAKPKYKHKNDSYLVGGTIPYSLSGKKMNKAVQDPNYVKQKQSITTSTILPVQLSQPPKNVASSSQPSKVLPTDTNNSVPISYSTPDTLFECRPFFETVKPSTSVQESSGENGKSKLSLIIRRVQNQNPNDVRRVSVDKVTEEDSRPHIVKPSKHQVKKKMSENREIKINTTDNQNEHSRASEQQIAFLTRRIETLKYQIETLTGQVRPLRLENEKYKEEIKNLKSRVEELETSTNSLMEQKNIKAKNDKKIEELKQSWERERFHFTQHLEDLQKELTAYKNLSAREKQKVTILNAFLERKFGLQEALAENLQKEKEILERHIPANIHYQLVMGEIGDLQRRRSIIYTLLSGAQIDCHINNSPTIAFPNVNSETLPLCSRQVVDVNTYIPIDSSSSEIDPATTRQLINVFNLGDTKIQYQAYASDSSDASNIQELVDLKREDGGDDGNAVS